MVHGYGTCYDTVARLITIPGPNGTLGYSNQACYPAQSVILLPPLKMPHLSFWDFGDGGTQFGVSNAISYNYAEPGSLCA